jgi:hypothetical protein
MYVTVFRAVNMLQQGKMATQPGHLPRFANIIIATYNLFGIAQTPAVSLDREADRDARNRSTTSMLNPSSLAIV